MPCTRSRLSFISATAMLGLCLVLAGAEVRAADDVVFMASVDKNEVALNETIVLIISIKAPKNISDRELMRPKTGTLKISSVRTEENVSFSFAGGNQSFSKIQKFVYILSPSKLGKTQIGAAKLKYKGKTYTTKPIDIEVVKARPQPKRRRPTRISPFGSGSGLFPDDDWDSLLRRRDRRRRPVEIKENDLFVNATATPDVVMQGQQVTATIRIYSKVGGRIASIRWPKLDGFFSVDRDVSKVKTDQKYINGELYQYKVLDRKALFPLQPGEISLGPVEVEVEVSSSPFFPSQVRALRTRPIKIKVMDLSAENRPKSFQEANVGQYTLSADVDDNEVSLNQPVTYTLRLRGTGNIQRVQPPELPELPRFKTFDPTVDVQVSKRGRDVTGSKVFEYILVPLASGELTIPALEFSFYDPKQGIYRTLKTEPEIIKVAASKDDSAANGARSGHEVNILAGAFKPIRYKSTLRGYGKAFYKHSSFLPILVAPPILYLMILIVSLLRARGRVDSVRRRMRRAWARSQRRLKKAGQLAAENHAADFFAELKAALLDGIEARTGLVSQGLTLDDLLAQMEESGVPNQLIEAVRAETENCDFGRFAPADSRGDQMQTSLERVRQIIKKLEKERLRPGEVAK